MGFHSFNIIKLSCNGDDFYAYGNYFHI